ncbi:MAG: beta-propeller domain-containing protein [Thermodesulfobacteriota bacterium]
MKRRLRHSKHRIFHLLLWASFCFFFGCSGNTEIGNPEASSGLIAMNNEAELDTYLRDQLRSDITADSIPPAGDGEDVDGGEIPGMEIPQNGTSSPEPRNRVIMDHDFLYVADGDRVVVLMIQDTGKPEIRAVIPISGSLTALHLMEDRLIAVARISDGMAEGISGVSAETRTMLRIIDVSAPGAPRITRDIRMEGEDLVSVEQGGMLYLVQTFRPGLPVFQDPNSGGGDPDITARENLDRLETASLSDLTPDFAILGPNGMVRASGPLLYPEDIFRPDRPAGGAMTVITALNPSNPDDCLQSTAFIGNVDRVYSTESALILSLTRACDGTVDCEPDDPVRTSFYQAGLGGDGPRFTASGAVWGAVDGPDAVHELNGILWALSAVETGNPFGPDSGFQTRLTALATENGRLEFLSALDVGTLPNRPRIRFSGNRAYVFSETGGIVPVDLSDPQNPRSGDMLPVEGRLSEVSTLKMDRLLGIGTGETGPTDTTTLHIALIDASETTLLNVLDREFRMVPQAESESALYFGPPVSDSETSLLALPLRVAGLNPDRFAGSLLLRTTTEDIRTEGIIEIPEAVLAVSDGLWILPRFIGGRLFLFHPGGVTLADPENQGSEPITFWFTDV